MLQPKTVLFSCLLLMFGFSCTNKTENISNTKMPSRTKKVEDGWYNSIENGEGTEVVDYGLPEPAIINGKPLIALSEMQNVKTEIDTELDGGLFVFFDLTEAGERDWKKVISNPKNDNICFVLEDTLINCHAVFTDFDNRKPNKFYLYLGYSDFTPEETKRLSNKLLTRLKGE